MIFTIICGLILVDEDEEYSTEGLAWVIISVALMIAGIQVLFCKANYRDGSGSEKPAPSDNTEAS